MLVSENIGKRLLLSANKSLNRINKSQTLNFIAFYKMSQVFLIWGCIKISWTLLDNYFDELKQTS